MEQTDKSNITSTKLNPIVRDKTLKAKIKTERERLEKLYHKMGGGSGNNDYTLGKLCALNWILILLDPKEKPFCQTELSFAHKNAVALGKTVCPLCYEKLEGSK